MQNQRNRKHHQPQGYLQLIKDFLGGFAVILCMAAFTYVYYTARSFGTYQLSPEQEIIKAELNGIYWICACFGFSVLSGLQYSNNRWKLIGSIYLLFFYFSAICFVSSLYDLITLDLIRMSKVYYAAIGTFILTTITYIYKWIKYYYF